MARRETTQISPSEKKKLGLTAKIKLDYAPARLSRLFCGTVCRIERTRMLPAAFDPSASLPFPPLSFRSFRDLVSDFPCSPLLGMGRGRSFLLPSPTTYYLMMIVG